MTYEKKRETRLIICLRSVLSDDTLLGPNNKCTLVFIVFCIQKLLVRGEVYLLGCTVAY